MITVQEVTCWYATNDLREPYEFNHLEDSFDADRLTPTPRCEYQRKAWTNRFWRSTCAALANGRIYEDPREVSVLAFNQAANEYMDRMVLSALGWKP